MTPAEQGRAVLARWKAEHSLVSPVVCSACQAWAPCPTARLIAALEEAETQLAELGARGHRTDVVFAHLAEPSE